MSRYRIRFFTFALLTSGLTMGCAGPPVAPGFVSTAPASPGAVNLGAGAGPGLVFSNNGATVAGGGVIQVDPFVGERLSIPVEIGSGGLRDSFSAVSRFGLRHRPADRFSIGFGGGPGFYGAGFDGNTEFGPYGAVDLEFAYSQQWGKFALSVVARPSLTIFEGANYFELYGTVAAAPAFFLNERVALTLHVLTGPYASFAGSDAAVSGMFAGGFGIHVRLGKRPTPPRPAARNKALSRIFSLL